MKISEAIKRLEKLQEKYGDLKLSMGIRSFKVDNISRSEARGEETAWVWSSEELEFEAAISGEAK